MNSTPSDAKPGDDALALHAHMEFHDAGAPVVAPRPGPWWALWTRMTVEDRRAAAEEYLRDAEAHAPVARAAASFLAAETKTRVVTVRKWPISKRAAVLANVRGLPPEHVEGFVAILHRRRRTAMLDRFLSVAGIPHVDGLVSPHGGDPVPADRLALAVRAIEREFPAEHVSLYLDALGLQGARPWRALREARGLAGRPPSEASST